MKNDYFGQYGHISKVVVYKNSSYNHSNPKYSPSLSAYLTYSDEKEASLAIFAVDGFEIFDKTLHCSYGTTKDQACPNRPDCVYLHSISKDHEYYYLNNHKNGTEDQKNSLLTVLRKYKKELDNFLQIQCKIETAKTVFPSILKIIADLQHIFTNEQGNCEDSNLFKKTPKPILAKSQSTNTEDSASKLVMKKESSSIKKPQAPMKPINIVDWEEDVSKPKEKSVSDCKTPESRWKLSEDLKSHNSNEKINDFLSNSSPQNEFLSNKSIEDVKLGCQKFHSNETPPERDHLGNIREKSSLEDDMKLSENKDGQDSFELIQKEDFEKKAEENLFNVNSGNLKKFGSPYEQQSLNSSPGVPKTFLNQDIQLLSLGSLGLCNEIEMKIIKNMLNETNQKSRFSFVQKENSSENTDKKENSLKEILLSSLKLTDFKRSCSLNFSEHDEKTHNFYSLFNNEGERRDFL